MAKTDLSSFDNHWYDAGAGRVKQFLWYITSAIFINSHALLPYSFKSFLLRLFGAKIGKGVVIKPHVQIKYPWKLSVGDYTWLGEHVWIDNLDEVSIGSHACISQGALILCGNHDYSRPSFDLIVKPITIEDGAWIGARSMLTQGVTVKSHAVLSVDSVASHDLDAFKIYRGNPATEVKERIIS